MGEGYIGAVSVPVVNGLDMTVSGEEGWCCV